MMRLSDYIIRSLVRGLAYRVAWATPVWLALIILALLYTLSLIGG